MIEITLLFTINNLAYFISSVNLLSSIWPYFILIPNQSYSIYSIA